MEDMAGWDAATAAIYLGDLDHPAVVWAFLVHRGLVKPNPESKAQFDRAVAQYANEVFRGGSPAARIADALRDGGVLLPAANEPDPEGRLAKAAWESFRQESVEVTKRP